MSHDPSVRDIKKNQQRNLVFAVVILVVVVWGIYELMTGHSSKHPKAVTEKSAEFASPIAHVDAESIILEKTEHQLEEATQKTDNLQARLKTLENDKTSKNQETINQIGLYEELKQKVADLEQQLSSKGPLTDGKMTAEEALKKKGLFAGDQNGNIEVIKIALTAPKSTEPHYLKNPDTYVPSGSFARAVMIGGADASAATNAQANPAPMLFRVVDQGSLPNHAKSHLKDCVVTAAAVGDISSERGMIRLESLSCTKPSGEIIDIPVEGTIFGPEGKNGVRGIATWREGAFLQRAFAAGSLSGFANALQQNYTTTSVSALGATQTVDNGATLRYGAASGASNAMNKLADYNIQRAEQYHPVIQLSAGTVVDVMFLKGFYLDGHKHTENEEAVSYADEQSSTHSAAIGPTFLDQTTSALPLSAQQIQRLKEHESELGFASTPKPLS